MKIEDVRRFALTLPEVTEEPHFNFSSFRVRGKILATVPPGGHLLHVFVDDPQRELMVAMAPRTYQKLWWGNKVVGLRIEMSRARKQDVEDLLHSAWQRKAPKSVARPLERGRRPGT